MAKLWKLFGVPVIKYHNVGSNSQSDLMKVTQDEFEQDMNYIKAHGYCTITLSQLADFMERKGVLPENPILISFDDGHNGVYNNAFPILKRYQFQANLNVIVNWVGQSWNVSWAHLKEMVASGVFDIQSHTFDLHQKVLDPQGEEGSAVTTRVLSSITGEIETVEEYHQRLLADFRQSKNIIEERLERQCQFLCYPWYQCNEVARSAAHLAGFRGQLWGEGLNRSGADITMIKSFPRYPNIQISQVIAAAQRREVKNVIRSFLKCFIQKSIQAQID